VSNKYRAILTTSQGRPGWILSFKHPFATAPDGRPLPKVRRGLGTTDESEAKIICEQMNRLLEDSTLWPIDARTLAVEQGLDERVIRIFYDGFPSPVRDAWAIREAVIPLPTRREKLRNGIPTFQFVGITGSCKTTLGRQLIGTYGDRFPSISNSRTTTCDIEILTEPGQYSAVVTFLPRQVVHQHIEECARSAIFKFIASGKTDELTRKFLEHEDQRFRLKYVLGDLPYEEPKGPSAGNEQHPDKRASADYRRTTATALEAIVGALRTLARDSKARAEQTVSHPYTQLDAEGQLRFEEDVDDYLEKNEVFRQLIEQVLDAVEERFRFVEEAGTLSRDEDGWPSHWTITRSDRSAFLGSINYFSSNHAERYGTLLTPLVDGIRVRGPFMPAWATEVSRFVILDSEGLGHTPDSASAVPLRITSRYDLADAVILTDRSDSSMQAASAAVLKSLVSSGHESKLVVCFTKFDTTRDDDSRPRLRDRQDYLRNSLDSAISDIGGEIDRQSTRRLHNFIGDRVFFLEDLNKGDDLPEVARRELVRLFDTVRSMARPAEPVQARPIYDLSFLPFAVQKAAKEFHARWRARLGLEINPRYSAEHWSRIKALSRYSAILDPTGYSDLNPVDDLASTMERHLSVFFQNPIRWSVDDVTAEADAEAVAAVKRQAHSLLGGLAVRRTIQEQVEGWRSAYRRSGTGSTKPRARDIEALYNLVVPVPDETPEAQSSAFLQTIRDLVRNAIRAGSGEVLVESDVSAAGICAAAVPDAAVTAPQHALY